MVEFRDVKIGVDDGDVVQIESGLKEGDKIVLNISSQVASGMKVDPHELSLRASGK
jgi:multidrug efflux pump subunit AcrA (membrane-fusion protein)